MYLCRRLKPCHLQYHSSILPSDILVRASDNEMDLDVDSPRAIRVQRHPWDPGDHGEDSAVLGSDSDESRGGSQQVAVTDLLAGDSGVFSRITDCRCSSASKIQAIDYATTDVLLLEILDYQTALAMEQAYAKKTKRKHRVDRASRPDTLKLTIHTVEEVAEAMADDEEVW
ncbi:uncharacterized protein EHS24_001993 [Apiotrichum porosum]|uniref:Uncharacterized protein n=1 Tax=Apiotrichum porosum TaxID=105984 RepID=A0A427XJU7_9TREE|nr:uncharacterized protein EHS24_001993 [Apiotrichum porosum]RSH79063.1 hypothetical protein EHS24_001993 [Apiotrichum porosum]